MPARRPRAGVPQTGYAPLSQPRRAKDRRITSQSYFPRSLGVQGSMQGVERRTGIIEYHLPRG